MEAEGTPIHKRFVRAYNELVVLLSSDDFKDFGDYDDVLPPCEDDLLALKESADASFAGLANVSLTAEVAPSESENPTQVSQSNDTDDDDDFYS